MEVKGVIETIGALYVSASLKNETEFAKEVSQVPLKNTTLISDAIKFLIDGNHVGFGNLLTLLSVRNYGVGKLSPFEYALSKMNLHMAEKMLEQKFDINSFGLHKVKDVCGQGLMIPTILFPICYRPSLKSKYNAQSVFEYLLKNNPDLNFKFGDYEETILQMALRLGKYGCAKTLLKYNVDLKVKNKNGCDALDYCNENLPEKGAQEVKDILLDLYKVQTFDDFVDRESKKSETDRNVIEANLVPTGLTNWKSSKSMSIVDFTVECINNDKFKTIKSIAKDFKNIFVNHADQFKVLFACIKKQRVKMLECFFDNGVDMHFTERGRSLLKIAIHWNCFQVVKLLVRRGVDAKEIRIGSDTLFKAAVDLKEYDFATELIDLDYKIISPELVSLNNAIKDKKQSFVHELKCVNLKRKILEKYPYLIEKPKQQKPVESPKVEQPKVEQPEPVELPKVEQPVELPKVEQSETVELPKVETQQPEVTEQPKEVKQELFDTCVNDEGVEIQIPIDQEVKIKIFWEKGTVFDAKRATWKKLEGKQSYYKLSNGKWIRCTQHFDRCQIQLAYENSFPKCHVLPAGSIYAGETPVKFAHLNYC
jgi:hypothetical protein